MKNKCLICLSPAKNKITVLNEKTQEEEEHYLCDLHFAQKKSLEKKARRYANEQF